MVLIEFTSVNKEKTFLINKDEVSALFPRVSGEGTEVYLKGMNDPFIVLESVKEITDKLAAVVSKRAINYQDIS